MKATNKPIPTPIDVFSTCGIPSTILLRTLVTVKITNTVPEIKTAPNAVCQLSPMAPQIVYEKNALRPRPGATITGTLATKPISMVAKAVVNTTAATALACGMPDTDNKFGITARIYTDAINIVIPAKNSVFTDVPCWVNLKKRSRKPFASLVLSYSIELISHSSKLLEKEIK